MSDDNYAWPTLVTLFSLSRVAGDWPESIRIYRAITGLSKDSEETIKRIANGFFAPKNVELEFNDYRSGGEEAKKGHLNEAAYGRLYVAETEQEPFLWLDSDTLCIKSFDKDLMSTSLGGLIAAAVNDPSASLEFESKGGLRNRAYEKAGAQYFNSGVMLIDPAAWKIHSIPKKWRQANNDRKQLGFMWGDQCILNFVLHPRVAQLPGHMNVLASSGQARSASILHFAGASKPWQVLPFAVSSVERSSFFKYKTFEYRLLFWAATSFSVSVTRSLFVLRQRAKKSNPSMGTWKVIYYRAIHSWLGRQVHRITRAGS